MKAGTMRPAPEQIAADRSRLQITLGIQLLAEPGEIRLEPEDVAALQRLLAATEPPTDAEIVERYNAFLERKGYVDRGHAIWFADGVEAFIGRTRHASCACGRCSVNP